MQKNFVVSETHIYPLRSGRYNYSTLSTTCGPQGQLIILPIVVYLM